MREAHYRSILKTISWRVIAMLTTMTIAFFVTGKWVVALSIASVESLAKIFLYYAHERAWLKIKLGIKSNTSDYQI